MSDDPRKKLCVIFDIDETLIHFLNNNKKDVHGWPDDIQPEDKDQLEHETTKTGHGIIFRPHLGELFKYFAKNKDKFHVALWTASESDYCNDIAARIQKRYKLPRDFFLFKYSSEDSEEHGMCEIKDLTHVYKNFPFLNVFNTILIDDMYKNIKGKHNNLNSVLIQPFAPFGHQKARQELTPDHLHEATRDNVFIILQDICDKVYKDINGCELEDVDAAFKTEPVFSPKRLRRMGISDYSKTYASKMVKIPSIGEVYQSNAFFEVGDIADKYDDYRSGGGGRRRGTRKGTLKAKRARHTKRHRTRRSGKKTAAKRRRRGATKTKRR